MPDEDKKLTLLISTVADASAARALQTQLEKSILTAKLLGKEYGEQETQLARVNEQIEAYAKSNEEAGKEAEKLEIRERALHGIFRLLGEETIPEFGEALHASTLGTGGAILAIGIGLKYLQEEFTEVRERAREVAKIKWDAQIESTNEFADATQELADSLEKAGKSADPIKEKYTTQLAVLNATITAHEKILASMEKEDIAAAHGDKAQEDAIKAKYEGVKAQNDKAADLLRLQQKQDEIDERKEKQGGLNATASFQAALVSEQIKMPDFTAAQAALKLTPAQQAKLDEARRVVDEAGGPDSVKNAVEPSAFTGDLDAPLAESSEHEIYLERQHALELLNKHDANQAIVDANEREKKRLEKKAEDARAAADANEAATHDAETGLNTDTQVFHTKQAGDEIDRARSISQRALTGEKISPNDEKYVQQIGRMVSGQDVSIKQAETMFQNAEKKDAILKSFQDRLFNAVEKLSDFSTYDRRLQVLEQRAAAAPWLNGPHM